MRCTPLPYPSPNRLRRSEEFEGYKPYFKLLFEESSYASPDSAHATGITRFAQGASLRAVWSSLRSSAMSSLTVTILSIRCAF